MFETFVNRYFPSRNYLEVPEVTSALKERDVEVVWLPDSPLCQQALREAGYWALSKSSGQRLRTDRANGDTALERVQDRLLEDADAIEKAAIVSRGSSQGASYREVQVISKPGYSN